MAKLYEIDSAIMDCFDEETGEVFDFEKLEALQMEREAKIEGAALAVKNLRAEAAEIKAEEEALKKRRASKEKQIEGYEYWLASALGAQKFETAKCLVTFTKSEQTVPAENFVEWANENNRKDLLNVKESVTISPDKKKIKAAIEAGEEIPAEIVKKNNVSIK